MIGFFGTKDTEGLSSLGFLMFDPECTATTLLTEEEKAKISALQTDTTAGAVEEESSSVGLVLGLSFGILALIGLAVAGVFAYFELKKRYPEGWGQMR